MSCLSSRSGNIQQQRRERNEKLAATQSPAFFPLGRFQVPQTRALQHAKQTIQKCCSAPTETEEAAAGKQGEIPLRAGCDTEIFRSLIAVNVTLLSLR